MRGKSWLLLSVGVAALGWADPAPAEWFAHHSQFACERSVYPKHHYRTPTLARWLARWHGYSVECNYLYPEIPGEAHLITFPCQYANPVAIPYGLGSAPRDVIPVYPYGSVPPGSK